MAGTNDGDDEDEEEEITSHLPLLLPLPPYHHRHRHRHPHQQQQQQQQEQISPREALESKLRRQGPEAPDVRRAERGVHGLRGAGKGEENRQLYSYAMQSCGFARHLGARVSFLFLFPLTFPYFLAVLLSFHA